VEAVREEEVKLRGVDEGHWESSAVLLLDDGNSSTECDNRQLY